MNTNRIICLLIIIVYVANAQIVHNDGVEDRDRRSVQLLFDGIIEAITQKHGRSAKVSNVSSYALPKASALKSAPKTTAAPTLAPSQELRMPEEPTTPMSLARELTYLAREDAGPIDGIDDTDIMNTTDMSESSITPPTIPDDYFIPASDDARPDTPAREHQAQQEERPNVKADVQVVAAQPRRNHPPRALSGRYTQYWGNPMFYHSQYSPLYPFAPYYNDIDYNTVDVGPHFVQAVPFRHLRRQPSFVPVPVPIASYLPYGPYPVRGLARPVAAPLPPPALPPNYRPVYFSPPPSSPLLVLPPVIVPGYSDDDSHSHVKTHDTDYDQTQNVHRSGSF